LPVLAMSLTLKNIKIDPDAGSLESDMFDKTDPYIRFYIDTEGWGGEKACTSKKENDRQPDWGDEEVVLENLGDTPMALVMKIDVYDDDLFEDDAIGAAVVDLATLMQGAGSLRVKVDNNIFASDVYLMLDYETSGFGTVPDAQSITFRNIKIDPDEGRLESDTFDKTDPYIRFFIDTEGWGGEKACTSKKEDDRQPDWGDEEVVLENLGENPGTLELKVDVYDDDLFEDDAIGAVKVDLGTLMKGSGSVRLKIDNNIFASDVYLMFDYDTGGWGN